MKSYREKEATANGKKLMMSEAEISELKLASKIVGGAVHPETNEIIAWPMRLSGFVSFNIPILALMLFTPH